MTEPRSGACAAQLQDGRVLIAGGLGALGVLESAELFDISAGFSSAAAMSSARSTPTCVTLQDGRVLVAGGSDAVAAINGAEIYDAVANAWSPVSDMVYSRSGHTATRLKNGLVLIAGGEGQGAARNTIEIFDPASNSFSLVTSAVLSFSRKEHAAVLLPDGRVLIAGGSDGTNALASTEIYDPATATLALGPTLSSPRAGLSATVLLDGNVLIAGGSDGAKDLASAEIFDTSSGKFVAAAQMTTARSGQLAFLLPNNNQVLLIGGDQGNGSAELFTPWRNVFGPTASVQVSSKAAAGAALGVDGALMVAGGSDGSRVLPSSRVYGFATLKAEQEDYALKITGSGWQPGERVTLLTQNQPKTREDLTRVVAADQTGNIADIQPMAQTSGKFLVTAAATTASAQTGGSTGANLDQCADGPNLSSASASVGCNWVNGNVNGSKATYFEGDSLPYRLVMTNVPIGTNMVTIEWDTTQSGKHALDYITSFDRSVTTAQPCAGVSGCTGPRSAFVAIPRDPHLDANGAGPGVPPSAVPQVLGELSFWGASSASFPASNPYSLSGSYLSKSSTRTTISFTANQ
jgi:hypothetical protein